MSWLIEHIRALETKTAIIDANGEFSYQALDEQIKEYQKKLATQVDDGAVVVILSDYNFYAVALFLALLAKRCVIVPIVPSNPEEVSKRLEVAQCDALITFNSNALHICAKAQPNKHPLVKKLLDSKQAGLILFSSGSTGEPKAMIHNLDNLVNSYQGKKIKRLNMLVFLMFDHIGGLNTLLNTLAMGALLVLPSSRNPNDIAGLIERHHIHVLPASPTFLNMLLMANVSQRFDLSSLKMITYGTEPMPESLLKKLKTTFPRIKFLQTFGTSETGITQTSSRSSDSLAMKLNDADTEYKIVNGELWLRSKTQVMGYLNASMESFTTDGWFKTGDLVEEQADGYIRIQGRAKEVINVGGEKALPAELESVIFELPEVEDCLVYGENNALTGQVVAVQLVLAQGIEHSIAKALIRKHCRTRLALYKVPVKFEFVDRTTFSERFKKNRLSFKTIEN